jgi:hypothetical protein
MRDLLHVIEKGNFDIQAYGRQQLKQALTAGVYTFFNFPLPSCSKNVTEDNLTHIELWHRGLIEEVFMSFSKVRSAQVLINAQLTLSMQPILDFLLC